jgi:hypothetical protein
MTRSLLTLALIAGAIAMAFTRRGLAFLGDNRSLFVAALAVLGASQGYRFYAAWRARTQGDRLSKVPKRPLGI